MIEIRADDTSRREHRRQRGGLWPARHNAADACQGGGITMSPMHRPIRHHHWKAHLLHRRSACAWPGIYSATSMPSSVFPQTNFPRVTIMIDNGEMPADEMMATITKPIEEAMKDVPGVVNIRSNTGRGSSVVNVFFNWRVDMDADRAARAQPAGPGAVEPAGDRRRPGLPPDVFRLPDHRHQPDQQTAVLSQI